MLIKKSFHKKKKVDKKIHLVISAFLEMMIFLIKIVLLNKLRNVWKKDWTKSITINRLFQKYIFFQKFRRCFWENCEKWIKLIMVNTMKKKSLR